MSAKQFTWALFSWLLAVFISGVVDGSLTGASDLDVVLSLRIFEMKQVLFFSVPWLHMDWVSSLWSLATWNFSWFAGSLQWLRWFLGLAMMGTLVYGFATSLLPVLISGAGTLISAIQAINPFSFLGSLGRTVTGWF